MPFGSTKTSGFNNPVITEFEVDGVVLNKNGLFVYSTVTPALGTLIASDASLSGFDSVGNQYIAGNVGYTYIASEPAYYAVVSSVNGIAVYRATSPAGPYSQMGGMAYVAGGVSGIQVYNQSSGASITLADALDSSGNGQLVGAGFYRVLDSGGSIAAPQNVTLDAGWSTTAGYSHLQYRLMPDNTVRFTGSASHASITATLAVNSGSPLPAAYRPATTKLLAAGNSPLSRLAVEVTSAGVINALANGSAPGTIAEVDIAIPLVI